MMAEKMTVKIQTCKTPVRLRGRVSFSVEINVEEVKCGGRSSVAGVVVYFVITY